MPVRVEIIADAVDDLAQYVETDVFPRLLAKLIRLEEVGRDAGQPLRRGLAGWRKIVVGNRDWRIIFTTDPNNTIATVLVIGDRADDACYDEAQRRVDALARTQPHTASLAAVMYQLSQAQRAAKRARRDRKRPVQ